MALANLISGPIILKDWIEVQVVANKLAVVGEVQTKISETGSTSARWLLE